MLDSLGRRLKSHTYIKLVLTTRDWNNNQSKLNENISRCVQENKSDLGHMRYR